MDGSRADAFEATVNIAVVMHQIGVAARPRTVPLPRYPMMVELDLGNRLAEMMRDLRPLYAPLIAEVPKRVALANSSRSYGDSAERSDIDVSRNILEQIRSQLGTTVNTRESESIMRFYGQRVSIQHRGQLAKQLRAGLGVDIPISDTNTPELLDKFARENASAIGSIPENMHQEIANLTLQAFRKRMNEETFARLIEERFEVSESKARFLARDQLGSLNGQLTSVRHQHLGITHYIWRTMRDPDVRPAHKLREGKRFAYDARPPAGGLPGEDYGCRCGAQPDLSAILAGIKDRRRFPGRFSAPLAGSLR